MSDRIKRRKKSGSLKRRLSRQGWRKPLLVLLMASSLVPAGLGYLNYREQMAGATDTAIGVLPESANISDDKPTGEFSVNGGSGSEADADGTAKSGSQVEAGSGGSPADSGAPAPGESGSAKAAEEAAGSSGDGEPKKKSSAPEEADSKPVRTGTTMPANPKGRDGADLKADSSSGADTVEGYERRLELVQEQCVRDAAVVLKQGETRMNEARRGELSEDGLKQAGAELSQRMDSAEAGCKKSFDSVLAEAKKADISESDRENWQLSYEQSRNLLRAKLTEQLQTLASAGG